MDERQFSYLQEMDIPIWVSREAQETNVLQDIQGQASPLVEPDQPSPPIAEMQHVEPLVEELHADELPEPSSLDWHGLQHAVTHCTCCPDLVSHRSQTIFGVGNPQADWLIIGDLPDVNDDQQGEPFTGKSGQLLSAMLQAIGLKRPQVYLTNILKCLSSGDHLPSLSEITACNLYLQRQIELIQPKIILVVGKIAAQTLLQSDAPVDTLRGKIHRFESCSKITIPLVVSYPPTELLLKPQQKAKSWQDLKLALNCLER